MSKHKYKITGLNNFISDVRKCKSREEEMKRINKELANIRFKFAENSVLEGYQRKKYVSKLIFIFLLGHNLDFGHIEAISLMGSVKYSEKFMGYLFASIFLNENSKLVRLLVKTLEHDLMSNIPDDQHLALKYIANMPNKIIADELGDQILLLLFRSDTQDAVKQSAFLSLLAVYRVKPNVIPEIDYQKRIACFLADQNLGVVTAAASLIEELAKDGKIKDQACISTAICRLNRLLRAQSLLEVTDYHYYTAYAPWLCVKLMRILRHFDYPSDPILQTRLFECIDTILSKVLDRSKPKKTEHRYTKFILLHEAAHLIHAMKMHKKHFYRACSTIDVCLRQREPNLRFLALECMKIFTDDESMNERIKNNLNAITWAVANEKDESIREKAADLLCDLCDDKNYKNIVSELFDYLECGSLAEKEKTVLKIFLLAEKHNTDKKWHVDTIIDLVYAGEEFVKKEIWYRFIRFVKSNSSMQGYSAKRVFEVVQSSSCNENIVVLSAYILGEFGNLIAGDNRSSPISQLNLLHSKFHFSKHETKALLLTTYVKFANLFPEIKEDVKGIFRNYSFSPNTEIQQRSVEYLNLLQVASTDCLATVLDEMPDFKNRKPTVENALKKLKSCRSPPREKKTKLVAETRPETVASYCALFNEQNDKPRRMVTLLPKTQQVSNVDILANAFGHVDIFNQTPIQRSLTTSFHSTSKKEELVDFIWNKRGTLFESSSLKVQFDSQFFRQEGRIRFKYLNKTDFPLSSFLARFPLENNLHKWIFVAHPCSTTISPMSEVEQDLSVECIQPFTHTPSFSLSFVSATSHQVVPIQMPMTLNKFIEPAPMSYEEFNLRWENDTLRENPATKTFPIKQIQDNECTMKKKLKGFGVSIIENDDPHQRNVICSGMFYSRSSVVIVLFILQPQYELSSYNLTVRSNSTEVSEEVLRLLESMI